MKNPYSSYKTPEESAKSLLFHYFSQAIEKPLDSDNAAEIGSIVDGILEAVRRSTPDYRLKELERKVAGSERHLAEAIQLLEECHESFVAAGEAPDEECVQMRLAPLQGKLAEYFAD